MTTARAGRHSFRSNLLSMGAGQLGTWSVTIPTFIVLPRYLGAEAFGQLAIGQTFASLAATVATLGMGVLINREMARDEYTAARKMATAIWLNVALGIGAGTVAALIGSVAGYDATITWLIIIAVSAVPAGLLTQLSFGALQGAERMRYQAGVDLGTKALGLGVIIVIVVLDLGVFALAFAALANGYLTASVLLFFVHRVVPVRFFTFSRADAVALVRASAPFWASGAVLTVQISATILILSQLADAEAVGIFRAPSRVLSSMLFVPTVIMAATFPRLAATFYADPEAWRRIAPRTLHTVVSGMTFVAVLGIGLGGEFFVLLVGEDFNKSEAVVAMMTVALIPMSANIVLNRVLLAADRERRWMVLAFVALVAGIALNFALIPLFGGAFDNPALGAATTRVVMESVVAIAALALLPAGMLTRADVPRYARLILAAVFAVGVTVVAREAGPEVFALPGVAGAIAYVLAAALLRVHTLEEVWGVVQWVFGRRLQLSRDLA